MNSFFGGSIRKHFCRCATFLLVATASAVVMADEPLSPAEQALLSQQATEAEQIAQAQEICEQIILSGIEPAKSQLIATLDGKTCAEAAQEAATGN